MNWETKWIKKYIDDRVEFRVNNELFWNNVFNDIRFSAKVHRIVQQELNGVNLPQQIQNVLPGILDNSNKF